MWLLFMLWLVGQAHVSYGGLTSTIANLLLKRVETELLPARAALDSFTATVTDINADFESRRRWETDVSAQLSSSVYTEANSAADVCSEMSDTLRAADRQAADFAYYIYSISMNELTPELQSILECEMRNPLLWLKCVYLEIKEVLLTVKHMRKPIDAYTAAFAHLENSLKIEYTACKQNPYH